MAVSRSNELGGLAGTVGGFAPLDNGLLIPTAYLPVVPATKGGVTAYGRIKISGTVGYCVPGIAATSANTFTLVANTLYYHFIYIPTAITIDQCGFVVTVGPASAANVRVGIYAADTDMQPTGAPLFDIGTAVAQSFTGTKTPVATLALAAGRYLTAINCDVGMTVRVWVGATFQGFVDLTLGAGVLTGGSIASTYGAMPNPGTAYTAYQGASHHPVALRVSVP